MRIDVCGAIVREKYPEGHNANFGDSCAETARAILLGCIEPLSLGAFIYADKGYLRHPALKDESGWGVEDFSNDQALPWFLARILVAHDTSFCVHNLWKLKGTKTWINPAVWAVVRQQWWLLNICNIVQGWLFNLKWRIGDGGKLQRSEGQVQDWLNYIVVYVALKRLGKWAILNQSVEKCLAAVKKYYQKGPDAEPNSLWIVKLYESALNID